MKNKLKRLITLTLAAIFTWGAFPVSLSANDQLAVDDLVLVHQTPLSSQNYTFTLRWQRPQPAQTPTNVPSQFMGSPNNPEGVAGPPAPGTGSPQYNAWLLHRATEYSVMRRDAGVIGSPWINIGEVSSIIQEPSFQYVNSNMIGEQRMRNGRIYSFRVDPRHFHRFHAPEPLMPNNVATHAANVIGTPAQVHFMTDIEVTAWGSGDQLTVQWSRPLINNADPFDSYRIFFAPGGAAVTNIFAQNFVDISITNPGLETNATNSDVPPGFFRFSFNVEEGTLVPGAMYAVAVEPRIGTATRRTANPTLQDAFYTQRGMVMHYTMNEYRTNNAFIEPNFIYTPIGLDLLQLSWNRPIGARMVTLSMRTQGIEPWTTIGEITYPATQTIIYWLIQRPNAITEFQLVIEWADGREEELDLIFDPSVTAFSPTRPNILHVSHDPDDPPVQPITLNIMWEAFHRMPYTQQDREDIANIWGFGDNERYFDPNVRYEVFITNDLDALSTLSINGGQAVAVLTPEELSARFLHSCPDHGDTWAHEHDFEYFWDARTGQFRPIEANTVYYIRINTRRTVSTLQPSWPAYYAHFVPGHVEVRPLIVPVPPLRVENETINSITIAWEQQWLEVFDDSSISTGEFNWHTRIAVRNGQLVFGSDILASDRPNEINLRDFDSTAALSQHLSNLGVLAPVRMQVLEPHLGYEIHVQPFVAIADAITPPPDDAFEEFVEALHNNANAWTTITPVQADDSITMRHTITGLLANTSYAIFFRPFNPEFSAGHPLRLSWWPSFLTGTTTDERGDIDVRPTVPVLTPRSEGDTWLRFGLRPYTNPPLTYEFRISEFPDFSTSWELEPTREDAFNYQSFEWQGFAATQLFPETTYYIWARAIGAAADGSDLASLWSNPITMRTLPIMIPDPPRGLGIASQNDVHIINLDNDRDLRPVEPNAMIITWLPHPGDENLPVDMQAGAMGTEILGSNSILHSYLVRFAGLNANRPHYVRARTIYSIHRDNVGGPVTDVRFNYIVEMATNPNFLDAITVFVLPDASTIAPGINVRMAMSDWTNTFIFHTARDDGEYDGDVIPELFPLPMHDFEIIYTAATQTLFFRFRSTGVDADGHQDNLVDQRFISRLIQQRVFDYAIDMTHYNNLPVRNRVVELPYSIITAFDERQISFTVTAGDTTYTLSPGFADTPQNIGFGVDSRVRLYIDDLTAEQARALPDGQNFVVAPQNIAVNIATANSHTNDAITLTTLAAPLNVAQSINQGAMMDANIGGFTRTPDDATWRRMESTFDDVAGTLNFATTRPAEFTAIGTGIPLTFGNMRPEVRDALYFVNSQIAFEDMDWFAEDNPINAWQINRIISAIARGESSVAINTDLTAAQISSLSNSGMLVPGADEVTREAAISALVRLYEVRTRTRVVGHPTLATSSFADMGTVTATRQTNMLKAEFLGFIDGPTVNPHGHLTMGDAMIIFEIILRN
ncbi:MAG: hypothetical protein FWE34_08145 [Defluviitaleaceae bacterium]|nr:hypothetical protein [Defluviitaleaceae bacterium]